MGQRFSKKSRDIPSQFDVVVIGGGTAGCVFARRLSDEGGLTVLLLEAGFNHDSDAAIRNASEVLPLMSDHPELFWNGPDDHSVPQKYVNGKVFAFTGGEVLGGSSSINGEQFVQPSKFVIDSYWSYLGPDWQWPSVSSQFARIINYNGGSQVVDSRLSVRSAPTEASAISTSFVSAMSSETKQPMIDRYNNVDTPVGCFTAWDLYQRADSERTNASNTYLPSSYINIPANSKSATSASGRLTILFGAMTNQIMMNAKGEAEAVQFTWNDTQQSVQTSKVIVTAGIHSAKLLMKSGIGPKKDLMAANIPVMVDSYHVGKNLANHLFISLYCTGNVEALTADQQNALYTGGAFLPDARPGLFGTSAMNIRKYEIIGIPGSKPNTFILGISPVQPVSRGEITMTPTGMTAVDFKYLSNSDDLASLRAMVRQMQNVLFKMGLNIPDLSAGTLNNDSLLSAYILEHVDQTHHWSSSCRMSDSIRTGVVDYTGKVFGTQNVYVGDVQAAPWPNDGNTSSIAYLISNTMCDQMLQEKRVKDATPVVLTVTVVDKPTNSPYYGMGEGQMFAINGSTASPLKLKRNQTYTFQYVGGGPSAFGICLHPLYFSTSEVGQGQAQIGYPNFPVCGGNSANVTFDSRFPDKFYIQCVVHQYMGTAVVLS